MLGSLARSELLFLALLLAFAGCDSGKSIEDYAPQHENSRLDRRSQEYDSMNKKQVAELLELCITRVTRAGYSGSMTMKSGPTETSPTIEAELDMNGKSFTFRYSGIEGVIDASGNVNARIDGRETPADKRLRGIRIRGIRELEGIAKMYKP